VPTSAPPPEDSTASDPDLPVATPGETPPADDRARAAEALRAAFTRLQPQGSDEWNFGAAFTHLGDRYGPYHPGASALSDAMDAAAKAGPRRPGRLGRLRGGREGAPEGDKSELEDAMGHVVEAFRFLSARVATLEARLEAQDRPLDGAAWFVPARELGEWVDPVVAHVLAASPAGDIVHADCGEGALLRELHAAGRTVQGIEPRGGVALRALESGSAVAISEVSEHLADRPATSLGGIVLSGVVDRLPLHELVPLLGQCRRTLALGAPLVLVAEAPRRGSSRPAPAGDVVDGSALHAETWELLLVRTGFTEVESLAAGTDGRIALTAAQPA
jgi:hypothetical protein